MATSKAKSAKKSAAKKTTSSKSAKVKGATSKAKTTVKTTSAKTAKKPKVVAKEVIAEPVEEKPKIMSEKAHPVKEFFARKGDPTENILTIFKDTKIIMNFNDKNLSRMGYANGRGSKRIGIKVFDTCEFSYSPKKKELTISEVITYIIRT